MSTSHTCPKCGAPLSPDAPEGLCPACLLSGALPSGADTVKLTPSQKPGAHEPAPTPLPEQLAPLFPHLEILELLGRGGMGAVYKARQKHLNRLVALKILPVDAAADPHFAERFHREAQALAKLSHPNIVGVFDFGVSEGLFYFLMEFVDGANLRTLIRGGEMKPEAALALVPSICDALQYAHDEGVVHRDIKPENVLVDKRGRVKIADFGLAKLLGHDAPGDTLTRTGMHLGTPRYMAPEQFDKPETVDHRADIYSLGVVFYEMLTGELPMGRFAPPSQKVQVDVKLDEIVLRSLERDVDRRYQHASEIKSDLQSVASEVSSIAAEASSEPAVRKEEDEEYVEDESPFIWRLWKAVPLVAVVLAFFNPWGGVAWYWFAGGCAILGILSGVQFTSHKDARPKPAVNLPSGAPPAPDSIRPLSRFFWLQTFGLLLLGWMLVGALWNYGTPGCVLGSLVLGIIVTESALRLARQRPEWRQAWRNARPWTRVYLVSGFVALAVPPFMLAISALEVKWEISPLRWNGSAQSQAEFEAAHKGKEYQLIRQLDAFKQDVPTTELVMRSWNWHGGWQIWGNAGPYKRLFGWTSVLASLIAATLILLFMFQQMVGAEKISAWHFATRGWRPALGLTVTVLLSIVTVYGTLSTLYVFSFVGGGMNFTSKPATVSAHVPQVQMALQKWSLEKGYAGGDDLRWDFDTVPRGQVVAQAALFNAWKPSAFDRWQMTRSGLRQTSPHVTAQIVGTEKPLQCKAILSANMRQMNAADKEHVDRVIQSMMDAVSKAADMDVKKPLLEQVVLSTDASAPKRMSPWWLLVGVIGLATSWSTIFHLGPERRFAAST